MAEVGSEGTIDEDLAAAAAAVLADGVGGIGTVAFVPNGDSQIVATAPIFVAEASASTFATAAGLNRADSAAAAGLNRADSAAAAAAAAGALIFAATAGLNRADAAVVSILSPDFLRTFGDEPEDFGGKTHLICPLLSVQRNKSA